MTNDLTSKLAVQMYTVREFTRTRDDLRESLQKISEIGYRAVQMSAVGAMDGETPLVSASSARQMLDECGLRCIATHRGWDALKNKAQAEIEFHQTLGCDFTAIGSLPGAWGGGDSYRAQGAKGYARWAREAAPVIAQLKAAGIRFGYHNHEFEFERDAPHQPTFFDILAQEGGQDLMMEIDVYWIAHAGANPQRVVEALHGRLPVIHIKDKEVAEGKPVMAPIGEGLMDWKNLLPACEQAGVEWYAVEQDVCRRDPFDCLRSSFDYLSAMA